MRSYETADEVFKRVDSIYQKAKRQDAEVFKEDIRLEPKIVYNVVEHLQGLAINKIDLDTKGVAFEKFMEACKKFLKNPNDEFFIQKNCFGLSHVCKNRFIVLANFVFVTSCGASCLR